MVECNNCHREVPEYANFCPFCGSKKYITPILSLSERDEFLTNIINSQFMKGTLPAYLISGASIASHVNTPFIDIASKDFQEYSSRIGTELSQKIREGEQAVIKYDKEVQRRTRATRITTLIGATNTTFQAKKEAKLFLEENRRIIMELFNPCENEIEFTSKIASLAALFRAQIRPLKKLIQDPGDRGSIRIIEKWLQDSNIEYDSSMIETWLNIVSLRNMAPIHHTDPIELKRILDYFGIPMRFPLDYSSLWDSILNKFLISLEQWQEILNNL